MPVDGLIDQLASLSLRAGPASQEGTSKKLEYKDKGALTTQLPLFSLLNSSSSSTQRRPGALTPLGSPPTAIQQHVVVVRSTTECHPTNGLSRVCHHCCTDQCPHCVAVDNGVSVCR